MQQERGKERVVQRLQSKTSSSMVSFRLPEIDETSERITSSNHRRENFQQCSRGDDYDFSRIVCPPHNKRKRALESSSVPWTLQNFSCSDPCMDDFEDEVLADYQQKRPHPPTDTSFSSASGGPLANRDSLALQQEEIADLDEFIIEHQLPDGAGRNQSRRNVWLFLACCSVIGVIVLTSVLVLVDFDDSSISQNFNVNGGSSGESLVHDNIFTGGDLPDFYYVLEPKVQNASALLDPSTAEGKAFESIVMQWDLLTNNTVSGESAKGLDLMQRYALMTMYFGANGGRWINSDGWSDYSIDLCSQWHGITCQNSVVTKIKLGNVSLSSGFDGCDLVRSCKVDVLTSIFYFLFPIQMEIICRV